MVIPPVMAAPIRAPSAWAGAGSSPAARPLQRPLLVGTACPGDAVAAVPAPARARRSRASRTDPARAAPATADAGARPWRLEQPSVRVRNPGTCSSGCGQHPAAHTARWARPLPGSPAMHGVRPRRLAARPARTPGVGRVGTRPLGPSAALSPGHGARRGRQGTGGSAPARCAASVRLRPLCRACAAPRRRFGHPAWPRTAARTQPSTGSRHRRGHAVPGGWRPSGAAPHGGSGAALGGPWQRGCPARARPLVARLPGCLGVALRRRRG